MLMTINRAGVKIYTSLNRQGGEIMQRKKALYLVVVLTLLIEIILSLIVDISYYLYGGYEYVSGGYEYLFGLRVITMPKILFYLCIVVVLIFIVLFRGDKVTNMRKEQIYKFGVFILLIDIVIEIGDTMWKVNQIGEFNWYRILALILKPDGLVCSFIISLIVLCLLTGVFKGGKLIGISPDVIYKMSIFLVVIGVIIKIGTTISTIYMGPLVFRKIDAYLVLWPIIKQNGLMYTLSTSLIILYLLMELRNRVQDSSN